MDTKPLAVRSIHPIDLAEYNEDMLFADGFDDALIGIVERAGLPPIACYNKEKCIEILMKDMSLEDADDYFYYNVVGSYVGENTPCFLTIIKEL
jgi:hypothetical protein